ncbi:MAG: translocation/assembly module TamB domain-containing protein [Opitutales bacterium]|nr:translocation/assembly module TamB domain-containing protein [Opitutales bacterium]
MRGWLKSWKFWLLAVVFFSVLAVITLPWWFAWGAQLVLRGQGISVGSWQVEGWQHYELRDIEVQLDAGEGEVGQLRMVQPWTWSLGVWRETADVGAEPSLHAKDVFWRQAIGDGDPSDEPVPGVTAIYELLEELQPTLQRWVPHLLVEGTQIDAAGNRIDVSRLLWKDGELDLDLSYPVANIRAHLSGPLEGPWTLRAETPFYPEPLELSLRPERRDNRLDLGWTVNLRPMSATGGLRFSGADSIPVFGDGEWLLAGLSGVDFGLPQLREVSGTVQFEWRDERWQALAKLEGVWEEAEHSIPVLLDIDLFGDTERAHFRALEVSAPWLEAQLDAETRFDFEQRLFLDPFRFDLHAHLAALEIPGLDGELFFSVETDPWTGGAELPGSFFELSAEQIRYMEWDFRDLQASGQLRYPKLEFDSLRLSMGEETHFSAGADLDFESRLWNLTDASLQLWHRDLDFLLEGETSTNGQVAAEQWSLGNVPFPESSLWTLDARGKWGETQEAIVDLKLESDALDSRLDLGLYWAAPELHLALQGFQVEARGGDPLELENPVELNLTVGDTLVWAFDRFSLLGASGMALTAEGRGRGDLPERLQFVLEDFESQTWAEWLPEEWPLFELNRVELDWHPDSESSDWIAARIRAEAFVKVDVLEDNQGVHIDIDTRMDSEGMHITRFDWRGQTAPFIEAGGYFPLRLASEEDQLQARVIPERDMDLSLRLSSRPVLLRMVEGFTGLELSDPQVNLELAGRFNRPTGHLQVAIDQIRSDRFGEALPFQLDSIDLNLSLNPNGLFLDPLEFSYLGDSFRATGEMPMRNEDWQALWEERILPDWSRTQARLESERFRIEALAPLLPDLIVPAGTIDIDLRLEPGWNLGGFVELRGASTRPLATGSGLRDINGRLIFDGTRVEIDHFRAYIERHALNLSGSADLSNPMDPGLQLQLQGNNLPIIRQQDLIIRGDADLRLNKAPGGPARISGDLNLRESLVLQDLRGVMRPGVATAAARPPFFSIEADYVKDWELNLNIRGDRFLRVQSPFFRGRLSSDLRLLGTLEEPYLNGALTVPTGVVIFPFGNIRLQQGEVRFASANPYDPQLDVSGEAETMGYTIRMNVSGSAYDPQLQFSSNPPLAQESIILMLTAGIMPSDEIGASGGAVGQRLALYLGRGLAGDLFTGTEESWTRNLDIRSGGAISESGRETYRIEYRLTEDFSIFGENDVFDEYNVGVRWRVFTR